MRNELLHIFSETLKKVPTRFQPYLALFCINSRNKSYIIEFLQNKTIFKKFFEKTCQYIYIYIIECTECVHFAPCHTFFCKATVNTVRVVVDAQNT